MDRWHDDRSPQASYQANQNLVLQATESNLILHILAPHCISNLYYFVFDIQLTSKPPSYFLIMDYNLKVSTHLTWNEVLLSISIVISTISVTKFYLN